MQPLHFVPWPRLLSELQRRDGFVVSRAELEESGVDPDRLVTAKILRMGRLEDYVPSGCDGHCQPNIEIDEEEAVAREACTRDVACWPGWRRVPIVRLQMLRCEARDVFPALGHANGLQPLPETPPRPFVAIGRLEARGQRFNVVWARSSGSTFVDTCLGLRARLGGDPVIVVTPRVPAARPPPSLKVAFQALNATVPGRLSFTDALDFLDPSYRDAVALGEGQPDHVSVALGHEPGGTHLLLINGAPFPAARTSDKVFLLLLLLAAARRKGTNHGWIRKSELVDQADLDLLRYQLRTQDIPGLKPGERAGLIESKRGTGQVRLGTLPNQITFEDSLASFELVSSNTSIAQGKSTPTLSAGHAKGLERSLELVDECRKLGVPLPELRPTLPRRPPGTADRGTTRQRRHDT